MVDCRVAPIKVLKQVLIVEIENNKDDDEHELFEAIINDSGNNQRCQAPGLVITGLIRGEQVDHSDEPIQNGEQEDHETEDDSHETSQLVAMATYTEAKPYSGHVKAAKNVLAAKAMIQT
ncbi:MAG: hypothetical protein FRX48_07198 [Lasallia pustulata]|uniref:Uncharacterized protein n=1 Tax=Lasallia pustulata TaxID=136370 RepID=A0A5M8PJA9_9LECA|nr:MAG: hypothetical protein FRX48_07198 [Lasallia pustulata]